MGLDLRLPLGLMFTIIGVLLAGYGVATDSDTQMYQASLGININLGWGAALFVFGAVMLGFALRDRYKR
jgi:hypothetical protein